MSLPILFGIFLAASFLLLRFRTRPGSSGMFQIVPNKMLADAGARAAAAQPDSITLKRCEDPVWQNTSAVDEMSGGLRRLGFSDAGVYTTDALPGGLLIQFLLKGDDRVYATIYDHPKAGCWSDLIFCCEDGTTKTFSTNKPRGLSRDPRFTLVNLPGAKAADFYASAMGQRPEKPLKLLTELSIVDEFEAAWREQVNWRKANPPTADEVLKAAASVRGSNPPPQLRIQLTGEADNAEIGELKQALTSLFERTAYIERAYLATAVHQGQAGSVIALCIASKKGQDVDLVSEIRKLFAAASRENKVLDILFVAPPQEAQISRMCHSFYAKP